MPGTNWVTYVNEELERMMDASSETHDSQKGSIFKVPAFVADLNEKAYMPQVVSFGPYHHGEEHLKPMEEHKNKAPLHFLRRSQKPLELFVVALAEVVQDLKDSYVALDQSWQDDTSSFLHLIILDGCFMLEIMRASSHLTDDYAPNDPVFSYHGKLHIMPYIRRNILMIENQLPLLVLEKLIAVESNHAKDDESVNKLVNKLVLKFCSPGTHFTRNMGRCLHVLDVYRQILIDQDGGPRKRTRRPMKYDDFGGEEIMRSAAELKEAGISCMKSRTQSLKDISFKSGVLRLLVTVVDETTECNLLNLMAFERFHVGAGSEVTSYVFFMDNIIDTERDVALLRSRGIIQNAIGTDKAVAHLFNSLSKDIKLDPDSSLVVVYKEVNHYCRRFWNRWRAIFVHAYGSNPLSVIAAVLLFALTTIQTLYTVYAYHYPNTTK